MSTRILEPPTGRLLDGLRAAWRRRVLVGFFGRQALEKLHTRTFLGRIWLLLRPGLDATLRIAVLGTLVGAATPGVPYALFAAVGLTAWQLLEIGGYWTTRSLEMNRRVLRRTAFPRLPILVGSAAPGLLYMAIYAVGTSALMVVLSVADDYRYLVLDARLLEAVAGLAMIGLLGVAVGLWLAPLAVRYRDVRFGVSYALGLWFFLTPVIYPLAHVDGVLRTVARFNPVSAPVQLVQDGILGTGGPDRVSLLAAVAVLAALLAGGCVRFLRAEQRALGAV